MPTREALPDNALPGPCRRNTTSHNGTDVHKWCLALSNEAGRQHEKCAHQLSDQSAQCQEARGVHAIEICLQVFQD